MPIVVMLDTNEDEFPEGAYCMTPKAASSQGWSSNPHIVTERATGNPVLRNGRPAWGGVLVLGHTHVGLCLAEREHNMRDDSDFYMTVWNPAKGEAEEIMFATTRGWTYPCLGSRVDATPEVRAAWEAWDKARKREQRIRGKLNARRTDKLLALDLGLPTRHHARRLREALGQHRALHEGEIGHYTVSRYGWQPMSEDFCAVARLLRTKRFKSEFRAKLAEQARAWAVDPAPRFRTPLSPNQIRYVR